MTDIRAALGAQHLAGEQRRHRHHWGPPSPAMLEDGDYRRACRCGKREDQQQRRRARSSVRLGKDQERRIERVYGPTKVGEFGDAIDHLGHDFKWQSKATRGTMPDYLARIDTWGSVKSHAWIVRPIAAMEPLHSELRPLLIRSYVRNGVGTTDIIIVRSSDWAELHGGPTVSTEYTAMTGSHFLDTNGTDRRTP